MRLLENILIASCLVQNALSFPFESNFNLNLNLNLNFKVDESADKQQQIIQLKDTIFEPDEESFDSIVSNYKTDLDSPLFTLHRELVETKSISGNENEVSEYLTTFLKNKGLTVELFATASNRNSIYAYLGTTRDTKVMLTSHIDTVPPFIDYHVEGDKIYGRGSCDAKGSVAAQITAFLELLEAGQVSEGDVSLLYVVSEEVGGDGMISVDKEIDATWGTVIFGEPTENKLAVGHKGIYLFNLEVHGLASHSGYPELGIDANDILVKIMHEISTTQFPKDELLGATTVNIGVIEAGVASNVVSPIAKCKILMRLVSDSEEVHQMIADIVSKYEHVQITSKALADPTFLDFDVPGFATYIAKYATDIPNLTEKGFKRYLYGPGSINVAHGANEYVSIGSLVESVSAYKDLTLFSFENN